MTVIWIFQYNDQPGTAGPATGFRTLHWDAFNNLPYMGYRLSTHQFTDVFILNFDVFKMSWIVIILTAHRDSYFTTKHKASYFTAADEYTTFVRLQNLPWSKTGLVSRQVLHPLSKLQNWIWSKTGRYKTGLVSNTKIEASLRATKPKPWQSNLTSDTVEIFIQNEKAGLVPVQSRFRSRHKAGFGAAGLGTAQSWFWSRHKASFGAVSKPV